MEVIDCLTFMKCQSYFSMVKRNFNKKVRKEEDDFKLHDDKSIDRLLRVLLIIILVIGLLFLIFSGLGGYDKWIGMPRLFNN